MGVGHGVLWVVEHLPLRWDEYVYDLNEGDRESSQVCL